MQKLATAASKPAAGSASCSASPLMKRISGWRLAATGAFTDFQDVGAFAEAAPDARCNLLYFQQAVQGTSSVYSAQ